MNCKEKAKFRTTSTWKNWCKYLKKKRNYKCECCGVVKKKGLQVHHMDEAHYTELKEDKFKLLCYSCHKEVSRLQNIKPENYDKYDSKWVQFYLRFLIITN